LSFTYQMFDDVAAKEIKFYVYALVDPRDKKIFYVGKGVGNRWYHHILDANKTPKEIANLKLKTIQEIHSSGKQVEVYLVRHGIENEKFAYEIEAAVISTCELIENFGVGNTAVVLSNIAGEHGSDKGVMSTRGIQDIYNAGEAPPITEPVAILKISKRWKFGMPADEIMESTWGWWPFRKDLFKAKYALGVSNGIIRGVYRIENWRERKKGDRGWTPNEEPGSRWGFPDGCTEASELSHYLNKSVKHLFKNGNAHSITLINCK
jgi:hypothetical protein